MHSTLETIFRSNGIASRLEPPTVLAYGKFSPQIETALDVLANDVDGWFSLERRTDIEELPKKVKLVLVGEGLVHPDILPSIRSAVGDAIGLVGIATPFERGGNHEKLIVEADDRHLGAFIVFQTVGELRNELLDVLAWPTINAYQKGRFDPFRKPQEIPA